MFFRNLKSQGNRKTLNPSLSLIRLLRLQKREMSILLTRNRENTIQVLFPQKIGNFIGEEFNGFSLPRSGLNAVYRQIGIKGLTPSFPWPKKSGQKLIPALNENEVRNYLDYFERIGSQISLGISSCNHISSVLSSGEPISEVFFNPKHN